MRQSNGLRASVAVFVAAVMAVAARAQGQVIPVSCGCSTDPTTALGQCLDDIRALPADPLIPNRVVNDIFHTSDGHDARSLTFGTYFRGLVGTPAPPLAGCIGVSTNIYDTDSCPGCACPACTPTQCTSYNCVSTYDHTDASLAHAYMDHLDWKWTQVARGTAGSAGAVGVADQVHDCPDINDLTTCSYNPTYGLIMDLGGEANRVAVFAVTDHTDNCLETFEWSVWLTDNPSATAVVRDGEAPDPTRWNRARLDQIFLQGWTPNPVATGLSSDTHDLNDVTAGNALADSPTVVFSLPCGVTFRYASVVSGNFGSPGPHCQFDSSEDEIDAVAGLNADNTAICPDADGDGYRAASCGGSDCNDSDPTVHPGAVETCSATMDLNCDGHLTMCPASTTCFQNECLPQCLEGACAAGFQCVNGSGASYCVPNACVGVTCPAGQVCGPAGCQDPCATAQCPAGQVCRGGSCLDPCHGLACPAHQHCAVDTLGNGRCVVDCTCAPCASPTMCSSTSGRCEAPGCDTTMCASGQTLDCTGSAPVCISPCAGVRCPLGQLCDATSGNCTADLCFGIACNLGLHCSGGMCVADVQPDAGSMNRDGGIDGSTSGDSGHGGRVDGSSSGDGGVRMGTMDAGCGCRTAGDASSRGGALGTLFAAGSLLTARRRRRRSPTR